MNTAAIQNIPLKEVDSSQISGIGHDAASRTLAIQFKNKAGAKTGLYHYANVTADMFVALREAPSIGSHFGKYIKAFPDQFPFRRIDG
jgi:hypothetical protein